MKSSVHGLLVIDKPAGITSRAAVNRAQGWFPRGTRIGHTGTLDPLATGVLVLCLGAATRLAEYVQELGKTYRTTIRLGASSDTDDAEGSVTPRVVECIPEPASVDRAVRDFTGWIEQVPPAFSAIKVSGRRAYDLARRGQDVVLAPRRIHVERIETVGFAYPHLELTVYCGEGTYIRSLARDIGNRLGCGGYVESLRRLRVGPFSVEDALSLDDSASLARARLLPLSAAVDGPVVSVDCKDAAGLRQGQPVSVPAGPARFLPDVRIAVLDPDKKLVAVCVPEVSGNRMLLRPLKVFPELPASR